MSDDLQRYRPEYPGVMMPDPHGVWVDRREVADRIEELEATLLATCKREAATQARHDAKVVALEAERDALAEKLKKAVLALENIECEIMIDEEGSSGPSDAAREARATLAQITGGKTDET